jgi:hypothetical protein
VQDVAFDRAVVEQQVEIPDPRILRFHAGQPDVAAGMLVQPPAYDDRQDQVGHALERADVDPAVARPEAVDGVGQRLRLRRCGGRCVPNDGAAPNCPAGSRNWSAAGCAPSG